MSFIGLGGPREGGTQSSIKATAAFFLTELLLYGGANHARLNARSFHPDRTLWLDAIAPATSRRGYFWLGHAANLRAEQIIKVIGTSS